MLFHGAVIGAYSTDEEGLLIDTRLGNDLVAGSFSEKSLRDAPRSYLHCDFAPELVPGCEDLFEVYEPILPQKLAIPKVKLIGQMAVTLPVIDVGFVFDLPLASGDLDAKLIRQWEHDTGSRIVDAVTLTWVSEDQYGACVLDRAKNRVLTPR